MHGSTSLSKTLMQQDRFLTLRVSTTNFTLSYLLSKGQLQKTISRVVPPSRPGRKGCLSQRFLVRSCWSELLLKVYCARRVKRIAQICDLHELFAKHSWEEI